MAGASVVRKLIFDLIMYKVITPTAEFLHGIYFSDYYYDFPIYRSN